MTSTLRHLTTPREAELGLKTIANAAGLSVSILPNGAILALEVQVPGGPIMINQVLGSPLHGTIGRLVLRIEGEAPVEIVGPRAMVDFGSAARSAAWEGEAHGIRHRVTLRLAEHEPVWFWQVELENAGGSNRRADIVMLQDVGLGPRGYLMGSEAYASQYLDHRVEQHPDFGPVIMTRQNLVQGGQNPWVALGCLSKAAAFATDAMQSFGPDFRAADDFPLHFGIDLPSVALQHEVACPALQSGVIELPAEANAAVGFFGLYVPHHPDASAAADLDRLSAIAALAAATVTETIVFATPPRGLIQSAPILMPMPLDADDVARLYPDRRREESRDGALLSFFTPATVGNRHVVLAAKEALVARRHGEIMLGGGALLPDDRTFASTAWMHGVFAAQLTIGNTSFHKLFSVSRDPYNITRASGLRMLVDCGAGWRLLAVPSAFEMGLGDCRWLYRLPDRTVTVSAIASGDSPAMQWRVAVDGPPCRFLVFGHVVLGERELEQAGQIEIDAERKRFRFTPQPDWLWGQNYPAAAYHLVTSTPDAIEAIGGDELLYEDGGARGGAYVAFRSGATTELAFAVVGSLTDAAAGEALADRFAAGVTDAALLDTQHAFWGTVTRGLAIKGADRDIEGHDLFLPWLAHDAMVHLTAPHGLEQYTGAAWGTRDVCQGPIEFLLALEHDDTARAVIRILFAEQYETRGDWPQWFMLPPYSNIRAGESHGDIVIWPLKALCDYIEATGDLAILDERATYRDDRTLQPTTTSESIAAHVERLIATTEGHFIAGTHLLRYGEGDWNDSLQPHDPALRDHMVSSWTVALYYEQLVRYAAILRRAGRASAAEPLDVLAAAIRSDVGHYLIRDGAIAGYGLFDADHGNVELLLHPSDTRTGLSWSLIAMTQAIIGGLFTEEQARRHLDLIREHLLFPDGARLIDRPVAYRGGPERLFKRAESSSFFGREIGLMYVHAHIRYGEVLSRLGESEALAAAIGLVNPIIVTERLAHASLRQSNAYFSSSDAAFRDRYHAESEWQKVAGSEIAVDGGWRVYSSGPGILTRLIMRHWLGLHRDFGRPVEPPAHGRGIDVSLFVDGRTRRHRL